MGVEHIVRVNGFVTGIEQVGLVPDGARCGDGRLEARLHARDRGRSRRPRAGGRDRGDGRRAGVTDLQRVAVLGAGTIGAVLARVLAEAGCDACLWVRTPRALEVPGVRVTADLAEALDGADLVSEAIVEAVEPKRALLARGARAGAGRDRHHADVRPPPRRPGARAAVRRLALVEPARPDGRRRDLSGRGHGAVGGRGAVRRSRSGSARRRRCCGGRCRAIS